jgi:hypothetical protein
MQLALITPHEMQPVEDDAWLGLLMAASTS